jgi:hypothetical protein
MAPHGEDNAQAAAEWNNAMTRRRAEPTRRNAP